MKTISKNDRLANIAIIGMSLLVFILISVTRRVKFDLGFDFDTHIFPAISAFLNSGVSILLILGLVAIKIKSKSCIGILCWLQWPVPSFSWLVTWLTILRLLRPLIKVPIVSFIISYSFHTLHFLDLFCPLSFIQYIAV